MTLSSCGYTVVDPGTRGVKVTLGKVQAEPLQPDYYFYNPFTTSVHEFDVREEKWSDTTEIFTKDTQKVDVQFSLIFHVDPDKVTDVYSKVGGLKTLEGNIIKPVVLGSVKDAIGMIIADELVQKREWATGRAFAKVKENLAGRNVIVTDLQFTDLKFDAEYEKAVEEKVVAIQNSQREVNHTVQIQEQAKQTVATAKAEAESMKIKSQALAQNKGLVQFEAVHRWDGHLPQYMFGSNTVPFIDMKNLGKGE
jgi:regulator of protease activity HflC (stomatin/prohibitin superfamily)